MPLLSAFWMSSGNGRSLRSNDPRCPAVVLVHGAWSDGSCWSDVISRLHARGVSVVSVQNPLSSLRDDVAAVKRAFASCPGSIVLVGHSWGGTVISAAGVDEKVQALVFISAFAPEPGDSTNDVQSGFPQPEYLKVLRLEQDGYLTFPQELFPHYCAQDLPSINARVLAAVQGPIHGDAFNDRITVAAWTEKPSWYLITEKDRVIDPTLQQEMAHRMHASIRKVSASHSPFASRPKETANIIMEAVNNVRSR